MLLPLAAGSLCPLITNAAETGTNELSAAYPGRIFEFGDDLTGPDWGTRFERELIKSQNILFDRLGPLAGYQFTRDIQFKRYGIYDEVNSMGRAAFERVVENSAQETALALLPVDEWMEILPLDKWQGFAQGLFQGSFGNTAEQELADVSSTFSTTEASWHEAGRDNTLRYGIRPRTAPYLYAASEIGHLEDRPALSMEARVRYIPFNRVETSLTAVIALPNRFELSMSAFLQPLQATRTLSAAVRVQRVIGSGPLASAIFAGVLKNPGESAILFGFCRPW